MKVIYLMTLFIFISVLASAQADISTPAYLFPPINVSKAKIAAQSKFGKVYALPLDNMPCIVPPTAATALMPVLYTPLVNSGRIPNAFPVQDLIAANYTDNNTILKLHKAPQFPSENLMLDLIRKK